MASERLGDLRAAVLTTIRERGYRRLDDPIELASGQESYDFVDAKEAFARGSDLRDACAALIALIEEEDIAFDAVGGLTLGADHLAHGIALLADAEWFTVRKEPKARGTARLVEGARLGPGRRVVLVEDVVTTGGSIGRAHAAVIDAGAEPVFATTLLDRGHAATEMFAREGVPYRPLLTYRDLGIEPIDAVSPAS